MGQRGNTGIKDASAARPCRPPPVLWNGLSVSLGESLKVDGYLVFNDPPTFHEGTPLPSGIPKNLPTLPALPF